MSTQTPTRAIKGTPQRPYRRGVDNAILGGVCAGLAIRLGVSERPIRIVFALLGLAAGLGIMLYVLIWLTLPRAGEDEAIAYRLLGHRRPLHRIVIALIAIVVIIFLAHSLGAPTVGIYTWPLLLSLIGLVGVWRGASPDERRHLQDLVKSTPLIGVPASRSRRGLWLRIALGVVLLFVGLEILRNMNRQRFFDGNFGQSTGPAIFGTLVLAIGVLVLLAPWWLATLNDLSGERRARVQSEERAKVAAHLHDSVLQTLTLIERAAGDETAVVRLARTQERELRQWLFDPNYASATRDTDTFTSLLHGLEGDVESDYGVKVELVTVGDCPVSDDVSALVAAGREAAINAAQWSGATSVFVFAEVDPTSISLFVRDQGRGFDPASVPSDRQGIELSIRQRMTRHGGTVTLKSTPGAGTDVQLSLPRS